MATMQFSRLSALYLAGQLILAAQTYDVKLLAGPGTPGDGGPALSGMLRVPTGIVVDAQGTVYVADTNDHRIRSFRTGGTITTVAGTGVPGSSVPGTRAAVAALRSPNSVLLDTQGRVVFADSGNCRVWRIENDGTLRSLAGTGVCGIGSDGIPAASSPLGYIPSILYDRAGNLIIADPDSNRIRQVSADGVITTIAGTGQYGSTGDGGPAISARLLGPGYLAMDPSGTVYFSDGGYLIRSISGGNIQLVAGTGSCCSSGDGGMATLAKLSYVEGLWADSSNNLYVLSASRVRRITPAGTISGFYGTGDIGCAGDGGTPSAATFDGLTGITQDPQGNFYLSEAGNHRIRRIVNNVIDTIAGGTSSLGDQGPAAQAKLYSARTVAVAPDGSIYVADEFGYRVRKISPSGVISTCAGTGTYGMTSESLATQDYIFPSSLAVDARARFILDLTMVSTVGRRAPQKIAGSDDYFGPSGDEGRARAAPVLTVTSHAFDPSSNLYVSWTLDELHQPDRAPAGIFSTVAGFRNFSGGPREPEAPASPRDAAMPHGFPTSPTRRAASISPTS